MAEPPGQSVRLDAEHLLAAFAAAALVSGYERHRVDVAVERRGTQPFGNLHFDHGELRGRFGLPERGVAAAFEFQPLEVHIGHDELFVGREALRLAQDPSVLGDQGVSGEDQVGRGFAEARRAIDVGRERPCRLLGDELPQVAVLADDLGRGREVEDHLRAARREERRGRNGGPEVLADLDAELRAVHLEGEIRAEVRRLARHVDPFAGDTGSRGEPAGFVELGVAGNDALGNDAQHASLREDRGAVVERRAVAQRETGDERERKFARRADEPSERFVRGVEQRGLQQQVAARVARDAEFGEHRDLDAPLRGLFGQSGHALRIVVAVADAEMRDGRRDLQESESIHRICSVFSAPKAAPDSG